VKCPAALVLLCAFGVSQVSDADVGGLVCPLSRAILPIEVRRDSSMAAARWIRAATVSAQCPRATLNRPNVPGADLPSTVLNFDFDAVVGAYETYRMPGPAGLSSQLCVEIVELR